MRFNGFRGKFNQKIHEFRSTFTRNADFWSKHQPGFRFPARKSIRWRDIDISDAHLAGFRFFLSSWAQQLPSWDILANFTIKSLGFMSWCVWLIMIDVDWFLLSMIGIDSVLNVLIFILMNWSPEKCARLQAACSVMTTFKCTGPTTSQQSIATHGALRVRSWASLAIRSVQRHDLANARLLTSRENSQFFPGYLCLKLGNIPYSGSCFKVENYDWLRDFRCTLLLDKYWILMSCNFPLNQPVPAPHFQEKKDRGFSWNGVLDLVVVSRTIVWLCSFLCLQADAKEACRSMMTMSFLVYQWM